MKKFISFVSATAIALSTFSATVVSNVSAEENDGAIKIMCIGDSITDGYGVAGSYRKFLYHGLTEKGYNIDMVGSKGGGWTPTYTNEETGETFEYDDENTGYSGYAIKEYSGRSGIYETLQSTNCLETQPLIVILQIGTNDTIDNYELDNAGERLETLIYYILNNIPDTSTLFVTTIPNLDPNRTEVYDWFGNYRHSSDWTTQYTDEEVEVNVQASVDKYNSIVRDTVTNIKMDIDSNDNIHPNLLLGDINSVITDVTTQLGDGVHPNNTGYKLMGEYWTNVLDDYLQDKTNTDTPVQTTTTEETTTTTTTSETVTETTTTAITETTDIPETETTATPEEDESKIIVSDLVRLLKWLQKFPESDLTDEQAEKYDLNGDRILDSFDLVLMRKELTETATVFKEKLESGAYSELLGDNTSLLYGEECIVLYPEDYETKTVKSSNSNSKTIYKSVNSSLVDLDEDDDVQFTTITYTMS